MFWHKVEPIARYGRDAMCSVANQLHCRPRDALAYSGDMRAGRYLVILCGCDSIATTSAIAQTPSIADYQKRFTALATASGLTDSARFHQLLDLDWNFTNIAYPEYATYTGYPGQNDRWTDLSVASINARRAVGNKGELAVVRAIDRSHLNPADRLSYDIFRRGLSEAIEGERFPGDLLQIDQRNGPQYAASTIGSAPAATVKDYENILARLRSLPRVVDQTMVLLDSGLKRHITPPRITLRDVPAQVENLIPDDALTSALLRPFTQFPVGPAQP